MPEVTVVIPTRNRWATLTTAALAAALAQQDVDLQIVIVDDGSSSVPPVHPGLADARVTLVRHPETRGVSVARNTGIREARGEWVAFLDDDDLWSPDKLRAQLDALHASGASFSYTAAVWVDEALTLLRGNPPPPADDLERALLRWNVVWGGGSNVLASRDLLLSLGGFDEKLFQLADWDLWIRLARAAPAAVVDDIHVALVVHRDSMLLVDRRDVFDEFHALCAKHRDACHLLGVQPDKARFARWVADGHRRAGRRGEAARTYVRGTAAPGNVVRACASFFGAWPSRAASRLRTRLRVGTTADGGVPLRPEWLERYR